MNAATASMRAEATAMLDGDWWRDREHFEPLADNATTEQWEAWRARAEARESAAAEICNERGWPTHSVAPTQPEGYVSPQETARQADRDFLGKMGVRRPAIDFEPVSRRGYIVKGLIAPGDVCAILGAPGAGKSVLAPYLAYAVAQGRSVFGRRVKPGRVLYAAAEDVAGMMQRISALYLRYGETWDLRLMECGNLLDRKSANELRRVVSITKAAVVIVDTVGAAWAGLEENSAEGMGQVVALARELTRDYQGVQPATRPAVILVHHTAKQSDGSPRGHSVLNGTLDASMVLERGDDGVVRCRIMKNRNGPGTGDMAFKISAAVLGLDEDGDQITAPQAYELSAESLPPPKLPRTESAALDVLQDMARRAPGGRVPESDWLDECDDRRVSTAESPKGRRDVLRRAYGGLRDKGRITVDGGFVSLPTGAEFTVSVALSPFWLAQPNQWGLGGAHSQGRSSFRRSCGQPFTRRVSTSWV